MLIKKTLVLAIGSILLAGCADAPPPSPPSELNEQQQLIRSLDNLAKQRRAAPQDLELKSREQLESTLLVNMYLKQADAATERNDYQQAAQLWRSALRYHPGNMRALQGLRRINTLRSLDALYRQAVSLAANDPAQALQKIKLVLEEEPSWAQATALRDHLLRKLSASNSSSDVMDSQLQKPVSLHFTSHNLMQIFTVISQMTGVNFIFDNDVPRNAVASIMADNTTAEDAINLLLMSNQLRKKVLSGNTLLIYPASQGKDKIYQDIVVKTFFLGYVKAKDVNIAVRNILKIRDIHVDERTNTITVRGAREIVDMVERLLITLDRPEAEVMLEVEVLEISNDDAQKLGINYPQSIGVGLQAPGSNGESIPLDAFRHGNLFINLGKGKGVNIDIKKIRSHAQVLANPRIRVKNNKKALIEIGEKLPVITAILNGEHTSEQVNYQDVGLKLAVTPDISLDGEIGMDVDFTLSSLGQAQRSKNGLDYYGTNNRMAKTVLSSRDGETQMLAGLISQESKSNKSGIPWLSDIPLLGRLFSTSEKNDKRTEVILLITPHIERNLDLPGSHISTIPAGTEELPGERNTTLRSVGKFQFTDASDGVPPLAPPTHYSPASGELPPPVELNE
ncbi:bacterial type II and III secretion system family protein [Serratia symbiotica]|uniref:Bacterial type II and III secretion system family protein n=2 Tax=Serratia symbiotica TaxID=138074 RepID=A0A7D5TAJ5_9GAMM|nr:bacterial type II and III secretion system family protein [Serratia symbiotica]MBQ0954826.1 bacterial type II and III secretion system family protein [Serratia symbiotica]QLH64417.1 bacterial type II and III secretion system family protein [Serratia symbiotica]QTP15949.1 bacterial type II and III secretion system family protein [Serratia symbiotica]